MIMPSETVTTRRDDAVGTIALNRPDEGNALTRSMIGELQQALADMHADKRVRAVVLAGAGDAFCVGRDVAELTPGDDPMADLARYGGEAEQYRELLLAMLRLPKPLFAAVHGPAEAGGAGLVLACDVVVGGVDAPFGFPEPRRGLIAGVSGPLLAYRFGAGLAGRLLVGATTIAADEAHRVGVYHELVATDQVWARARELAVEAAAAAPQAIQLTKRLLMETLGETLETQLASGAIASATARTTDAAAEGLAAHAEGRPPEWP